ncbi:MULTISPECIES: type II toxin-antitoxin system HigB family toxin [unclassified Bartonella]|uniref:type II toxin-antitoxin system HigB family toxin n=1 Tax=unclassified Bartonella TaxID=2645622 RepID=UPI00099AAEB0|nr:MULTISPECIES: type II toxin-antitoxin system HigB family toxin [unclassified Bartonella]AQX17980.1 mRNA interferase HigB [Bartonella sp. A1379B]AQX22493.1 mRNA interferase HigB [Bartonella sp. 11B]AQX24225.1 mRNA interferase HigB [Bartonella sp. 114]AQX24942.1 mRNA interferase HigB [Bartonella sp. Coyote22sub2]
MKIVKISTLQTFWAQYPDAEQPLKAWVDETKNAQWRSPHDIKEKYKNASILKNNQVVFNIRGNDYRLIVSIFYPAGWLYIKFIGTHKQYDAIDANTVELKELKK